MSEQFEPRTYYKYKVWNANPQKPDAPRTPGIVMVSETGRGEDRVKEVEVVDSVRAVILFKSTGRELARGSGKAFRTVCSSFGGDAPSAGIDKPLCKKANAQDLAQIFSQWKGFDQAKVDAKIAEVTDETGHLKICGLKTKDGHINLCPFARKDPDTGQAGACKSHVYLLCYDLDRKREFTMQLGSKNTWSGEKYTSPILSFYKEVHKGDRDSYEYEVELLPELNGSNFILGVKKLNEITEQHELDNLHARAVNAAESYRKRQERLSKAAYEAQKQNSEPVATKAAPVKVVPASKKEVADPFFDDDIPF